MSDGLGWLSPRVDGQAAGSYARVTLTNLMCISPDNHDER
jgi:hypothetical protein